MNGLRQKMLDDLMDLSDAYQSENREMKQRGYSGNLVQGSPPINHVDKDPGIPYDASEVARRQDAVLSRAGPEEIYGSGSDRYQGHPSYSMPSAQPGFPAPSGLGYSQPQPGYGGASYMQEPGYPVATSYAPAPGYAATSRPLPGGPSYVYGNESPRQDDPYRQPNTYGQPARADPGRYAPIDPRMDSRMDSRDPRTEYREPRNPRGVDSRLVSGYPPVNSPGDVPMRDYDYAPPVQPSRGGGSYAPPRGAPAYDSREPIRDPYRNEPIREERRRDRR